MTKIKSPLNYTGGKYKLLDQILPILPNEINTFVDLFCGGCNVGININANKVIMNDSLTQVIEIYKTLQQHSYCDILQKVENIIDEFSLSKENKEGYLALRERYNINKEPFDLLVLIFHAFSNQIRFNKKQEYNMPFGKDRSSFNSSIKNNLEAFTNALHEKNIEFVNKSFIDFNYSSLTTNDVVYCDPPYLITVATYNESGGWGDSEEVELLNKLNELHSKGIKFVLSNVTHHKGKVNNFLLKFIEDNDYTVHYLKKNYSNANYQTHDRNPNSTVEVLVTNITNDM